MPSSILLLGSGFVAGPCASYLDRQGHKLIVGCRTLSSAQSLCRGLNATPLVIDVLDPVSLDKVVSQVDLVISLLPYIHHTKVVLAAIKFKKHVVTTSFISPAILELDQECKEAGIVVMNEIGVDPGIDLLYAAKIVSKIREDGGKVLSFMEVGAALPAPDCMDNPLAYKFSWSPAGSLRPLSKPAKYLKNGTIVDVDGEDLLEQATPYKIDGLPTLYAYPNRDSTSLIKALNIPEAHTVLRCTARWEGFCETLIVWKKIGLLNDAYDERVSKGKNTSWIEVLSSLLNTEDNEKSILHEIDLLVNTPAESKTLAEKMRSLGLLSTESIIAQGSMLETLSQTLVKTLIYREGERDLMILQLRVEAERKDGTKEIHLTTLEEYGIPDGASAMARTVGIPCGIAADAILKGNIRTPGVQGPYDEATCAILRDALTREGITLKEEIMQI